MYSPRGTVAVRAERTGFTSRRWDVWQRQLRAGQAPCFGTPERFFCSEAQCPFRAECRGLRANWQR